MIESGFKYTSYINDNTNNRGITLTGKLLVNIILCDNVNILNSCDLYVDSNPNTHFTFLLNEIIDYYLRHHSSLYLVLFDAFQTFDRVQYVKIFRLLIQRGISSFTARFWG